MPRRRAAEDDDVDQLVLHLQIVTRIALTRMCAAACIFDSIVRCFLWPAAQGAGCVSVRHKWIDGALVVHGFSDIQVKGSSRGGNARQLRRKDEVYDATLLAASDCRIDGIQNAVDACPAIWERGAPQGGPGRWEAGAGRVTQGGLPACLPGCRFGAWDGEGGTCLHSRIILARIDRRDFRHAGPRHGFLEANEDDYGERGGTCPWNARCGTASLRWSDCDSKRRCACPTSLPATRAIETHTDRYFRPPSLNALRPPPPPFLIAGRDCVAVAAGGVRPSVLHWSVVIAAGVVSAVRSRSGRWRYRALGRQREPDTCKASAPACGVRQWMRMTGSLRRLSTAAQVDGLRARLRQRREDGGRQEGT
ncbi:hypothetical protein DFH06DRAFT_1424161 [Mycena polygramma]|nr:hypothetical protein DFH06DRAFT_1424161 [Mycena polygramma]